MNLYKITAFDLDGVVTLVVVKADYEWEAVKTYLQTTSQEDWIQQLYKDSDEDGEYDDKSIFDPYNFNHWLTVERVDRTSH